MGMYGVFRPVASTEIESVLDEDSDDPQPFEGDDVVSVEKMWGALHFLFTGTAFEVVGGPLGRAILGGAEIGEDIGYGPARVLTAEEVHEVASALRSASFDELWKRFDAQKMNALQIYPQVWDEDEADLRGELEGYFDALVGCYVSASQAGKAMLLAIC